MKNRAIRIAFALTILLGVFVFILSCGDQTPNNTKTTAPTNPEAEVTVANPCQPNQNPDVEALRTAIATEIAAKPNLRYQKEQGVFDVKIDQDGSTIVMRVQGKLRGIEAPENASNTSDRFGTLKTLLRILDKYMKKGCVHKVIFESEVSELTTSSEVGFEWGACEDGKILCQNGVCQTTCPNGMVPKETPNTNTNSNVNNNAPMNPNRGNSNGDSTNENRSSSNGTENR